MIKEKETILSSNPKLKKVIKNKIHSEKKKENEIYISAKKRNYVKMYFERAYELFQNKNYKEIFIYGLGICVSSAVNLSLTIIDGISCLKINKIDTETKNSIDDVIGENMPMNVERNTDRKINFVKIHIIKN